MPLAFLLAGPIILACGGQVPGLAGSIIVDNNAEKSTKMSRRRTGMHQSAAAPRRPLPQTAGPA
jgi:hypothetical protein